MTTAESGLWQAASPPATINRGAQQAVEQAYQETEAKAQRQLIGIEAAVDGIALLKNDRYQYLNSSHVRMFGYERASELVGQSWEML